MRIEWWRDSSQFTVNFVEKPSGISPTLGSGPAATEALVAPPLRQPDEIQKEAGPEIKHATPGVADLAVSSGGQETGSDIVIDLLF